MDELFGELHQQEESHQQEEYETRVLVFRTDFKNDKWIGSVVGGFSPVEFVGTRKQYDEATAIYKDHSYGKIIGTHTHTIEEWEKLKPKNNYVCPFSEEAEAKSEASYQKLRKEMLDRRKRGENIGRLGRLFLAGKI